jgi:hypothetical protein
MLLALAGPALAAALLAGALRPAVPGALTTSRTEARRPGATAGLAVQAGKERPVMPAGPAPAGPMAQYAGTGRAQARAAGLTTLMRLAGPVRPGLAPVPAVGLPGAVGQRGGSAGVRTGPGARAGPAGAVVPELAGPTEPAVATGPAGLTKRGVLTAAVLRRRVAQLDRERAATSQDGRPGLGKWARLARHLDGPGTIATPGARAVGPVAGRGPRRARPPGPDPGQAGARADTHRGMDSRQATHE